MANNEPKTNATPSASEGDKDKKYEDEIKQLKEQNAGLEGKVSDLQATIISPNYQEFIRTQNQPSSQFQPASFAAGRTQSPTEEIDLESMDRKQYSQYLINEMKKVVQPNIDAIGQTVRQGLLQSSIEKAKTKHSDFDNHKVAMGKTAARIEAGGLTAEDVYKIQTWQSPQKEGKEKVETKTEKPTGGGAAPTTTEKLTPQQIASKVWDDKGVDEKHPTVR